MFKVPYFLEGISNIFKPVLINKEKFENAKVLKIIGEN